MTQQIPHNLENVRIVLIEDDPEILALINMRLRKAGFKYIVKFNNADSALSSISQAAPDVILCDWKMPGMSGLELLKTIRGERSLNRDTPFIMLTSVKEKVQVIEALEQGVSDYITKPFNQTTLVDKILKALIPEAPKTEPSKGIISHIR